MNNQFTSDNLSNGSGFPKNETVIMEIHANTSIVILGFFIMPLWLALLDFKLIKGYSIFKSLLIALQQMLQQPLMLGVLTVLEILVIIAFIRMRSQKLILTNNKLKILTVDNFNKGFFKIREQELMLTDIKSIYTKVTGGFIEKKFKCSTIIIIPADDKEITLDLMNNAYEFIDKVNYQIVKNKKA